MTDNNVIALTDTAAFATGGMLPAMNPARGALDMLRAHTEMMNAAHQLAKALTNTSLVPAAYRSTRSEDKTGDAAAAILYGAELGLNPIQSLQQVFVVHGNPAIYSRTMAALLRGKGFRFQTVESNADRVTVLGTAPDGETEQSTWDIERAERAGYTKNSKYQTDPQAMLYAKAVAEVARKLAPDVLLGMPYTREDLELDPAPVRVESERVSAAEVLDTPIDTEAAGEKRDNPAPAGEPAEAMSTKAQHVELAKLLEAAGVDDRPRRLAYLSEQFGRSVTAWGQLTAEEAQGLIEFLQQPADEGQPVDLVNTDETAGGAE
ncbi:hypothetical protein GV792_04875 [Nocardia cyriacigeorgica]|uniref:hypothetical protein n=1 Tax=Nocardia cyriacigeorgica TaxID=135487 RepID=UPI0013B8D815|nr:hypothetical protein [Nocardia cyriacigeorgica]NEW49377.1 hypothetical protein [Nocardia cyriacigeorgica]